MDCNLIGFYLSCLAVQIGEFRFVAPNRQTVMNSRKIFFDFLPFRQTILSEKENKIIHICSSGFKAPFKCDIKQITL